jgi:hypothetical protein
MSSDIGIDTLIDLNGNIVQQERRYWVEIHAWRVAATALIPHGIRYALTMHDMSGKRAWGMTMLTQLNHLGALNLLAKYYLTITNTGTSQIKVFHTNSKTRTSC